MDICLIGSQDRFLISPKTIHGILWLQTHFDSDHWETITNSQVILESYDAKLLRHDAEQAGISITFQPSFSNSPKFY